MQASRHAGNLFLSRESTVSSHRINCASGIRWLYGRRYLSVTTVNAQFGETPASVKPDETRTHLNSGQTLHAQDQKSDMARKDCTTLIKSRRTVVVISGPTAVGKTNVALRVAQVLGGEIISADSVQVRQGKCTLRESALRRSIAVWTPCKTASVG